MHHEGLKTLTFAQSLNRWLGLRGVTTMKLEIIMKHFIWKTGIIETANEVPKGAIYLGEGDETKKKIEAVARHMHNGDLVAGTVFDAYRAEIAKSDAERSRITMLSVHPKDTPEQALERWLAWTKLG